MATVAIDIDDTLYSFNNLAREVFVDVALEEGDKRMQRGAYCAWTEWRTPADVTDGNAWARIIERCHSGPNICRQTPFPSAAKTLQELVREGYELHYISNRSHDSLKDTMWWLEQHDFPVGSVTCNMDAKLPQVRDCQYIIDDRPKTLVEFVYDFGWKHRYGSENAAMQRKGFGLHTPYNAALTDVPGIKLAPNWKLLRQYMIDQGVLSGTTH